MRAIDVDTDFPPSTVYFLRKLTAMKQTLAMGGLMLGCAASLPAARGAAFDNVGSYFSFHLGDGGLPDGISSTTGQNSAADASSFKLFGDCGPITGADFAPGFVLTWGGGFTGPINPDDTFTADVTFDVSVTGGTLTWNFFSDLWSNEGGERARILTDLMPVPASGHVNGVHLESTPFTTPGDTGIFEGYLHIDWTGFSPTDTFSIHIPQNSIDIAYGTPAPEPGSLLVAGLGMMFLLVRRRPSFSRALPAA